MPPKSRVAAASKRDGGRSTQGSQLSVAAPMTPQPGTVSLDASVTGRRSRSRVASTHGGARGRAVSAAAGAWDDDDSNPQLDSQPWGSVGGSRRPRGATSVPPLGTSSPEPGNRTPLGSMAVRVGAMSLDPRETDVGRPMKSAAHRTAREAVPPTYIYDGTSASFNNYLQDFLRVADFNGWDSNDRAFHLCNCVVGNAKIKVKALPYTSEFTVLLQQYMDVFSSDRALETYRDQLAVFQRRPEQDLDTYGHVLLDMG